MTTRKLDANDLENFRAAYTPGKEHLWPLEKSAVVNDIRCLLATYDELVESAAHFERQWAGVKAVLEAGTFESAVECAMRVCAERDELRAQLSSLRQCSTCCGTPHASGLPCICGGTNRAEDEVKNLRLESMVLRDAVARMGEELRERDELKAALQTIASAEQDYSPSHVDSLTDLARHVLTRNAT